MTRTRQRFRNCDRGYPTGQLVRAVRGDRSGPLTTSAVGPFLTVGPDHVAERRSGLATPSRAGRRSRGLLARGVAGPLHDQLRQGDETGLGIDVVGDGEGENQLPLADCEVRGVAADRER